MSIYAIIYVVCFSVILFGSMWLNHRVSKSSNDVIESARDFTKENKSFLNDIERAMKKWKEK